MIKKSDKPMAANNTAGGFTLTTALFDKILAAYPAGFILYGLAAGNQTVDSEVATRDGTHYVNVDGPTLKGLWVDDAGDEGPAYLSRGKAILTTREAVKVKIEKPDVAAKKRSKRQAVTD